MERCTVSVAACCELETDIQNGALLMHEVNTLEVT